MDDLIITLPKLELIRELYKSLSKTLKVKDLGNIEVFLGIHLIRNRKKRTISFSQESYSKAILKRFRYTETISYKPLISLDKLESFTETAIVAKV